MAKNVFNSVQGNHPSLNRFDLSYTHMFTAEIGRLYVAQVDECAPGDVWKIGASTHIECTPLVAPLLSDLDAFAHSFFVPYRLLYGIDNADGKSIWEKFITGGEDGLYDTPLPNWSPNWSVGTSRDNQSFSTNKIWDSCGFPVAHTLHGSGNDAYYSWDPIVPYSTEANPFHVSIAPKRSYNLIWNEFYRDINLQDEVDLDQEDLLFVSWKKDFFTSALEFQQRGIAPALPISGKIPLSIVNDGVGGMGTYDTQITLLDDAVNLDQGAVFSDGNDYPDDYNGLTLNMIGEHEIPRQGYPLVMPGAGIKDSSVIRGRYGIDLSNAVTFTIHDLRLAFAEQRLMELDMRAGTSRYTSYLSAHYGVSPTDERLDRPEYIGGCKIPLNVAPVVQTSGTEKESGSQLTAQGHKAGTMTANGNEFIGKYRVVEHGLIMTMVSIRPKPCYHQGINPQWLRQSRFSYYSPEFANLSEVAVKNASLFVDGTPADQDIFGYQACWNEMRCKQNIISGAIHDQYSYWAMFRNFGSRPALNADFISLNHPEEYNRIFAVQDEDPFIVSWSNLLDVYRPIPLSGEPGLIDHVYGGK
nr:MAG: major capsid protein [Microviridae sp.]